MSMVKQRYQWLIDGVACDNRTIRPNLRNEYIWVGRRPFAFLLHYTLHHV